MRAFMWDKHMYVDNRLQFGAQVAFVIACPLVHDVDREGDACQWGLCLVLCDGWAAVL